MFSLLYNVDINGLEGKEVVDEDILQLTVAASATDALFSAGGVPSLAWREEGRNVDEMVGIVEIPRQVQHCQL